MLLTLVVAASLIGSISVFANGENGYETVGGEVAPINFVTTFLVPSIVIVAVFGALIILGVIRISRESHKA
jgi:hypothetical protein